MKIICSIFGLVCIFTIKSTGANAGIELEKQAIDAANGALNLYNQLSTETVPPNTINEIIQDLKTTTGVSREDSNLLGEMVTYLMNGMDSYFNVVQKVREWCGFAIPSLTAYKQLDNLGNLANRRSLLLRVLRNEVDGMCQAQVELNEMSSNLKEAAGKMAILQEHLKSKSDEQSKSVLRFAENAGAKLNKAHAGIIEINEKLKPKIDTINNLKVQLEESESYSSTAEHPNIIAVESAQKSIADCVEYRKITTY